MPPAPRQRETEDLFSEAFFFFFFNIIHILSCIIAMVPARLGENPVRKLVVYGMLALDVTLQCDGILGDGRLLTHIIPSSDKQFSLYRLQNPTAV